MTTMIMRLRRIYLAFLRVQEEARGGRGRAPTNPWPKCPVCWRRVPDLCPGTGEEPCGFCTMHGCCPGHDDTDSDN